MIIVLEGNDPAAKHLLGNSLRDTQISSGKGALLMLTDEGEVPHLLEKIIVAEPFIPGKPVSEIPWKPDSAVIVASEVDYMIDRLEAHVPGFIEHFGPITSSTAMNTKPGVGFFSRLFQ